MPPDAVLCYLPVAPAQVSVGSRRPYADASGAIHWPVLLLYPETMQQDVVEDWCDDDAVADHLDVVRAWAKGGWHVPCVWPGQREFAVAQRRCAGPGPGRPPHKTCTAPCPTRAPRQMFGEGAPPLPWDAAGEYSRRRVELYYLSNAGRPLTHDQLVSAMAGKWPDGVDRDTEGPRRYGPDAAKWQRVEEGRSLRQVLLEPGHVVPGVPLFWVVAQGTDYRDRFLANADR